MTTDLDPIAVLEEIKGQIYYADLGAYYSDLFDKAIAALKTQNFDNTIVACSECYKPYLLQQKRRCNCKSDAYVCIEDITKDTIPRSEVEGLREHKLIKRLNLCVDDDICDFLNKLDALLAGKGGGE